MKTCSYTELCEYECEITEDPEVTLDDGIDNDCDDLRDEPPFYDDYGVYIWEFYYHLTK